MSEEAGSMMVTYDDPSDQRSLSLDDTSSTEESPDETRLSLETTNDAVPYIGQRFTTHDAAYEFYSEFAKRCGFSIRRHRTEGKDGVGKGLTRRYFVCHRAGNTPIKTSNESKPQRNRKSSRCGCQAYLRISKTTDSGAPEWRVTGFANHHNHELLEPNQVRFLPAYRTISDTDKSRILIFAKTGISVQQMMRLLELEKCVEPGYLPFTEKDVRNLIQSFRKVDQEDESIDLLRMCRNIKEKDPNFRFEYTLDSNNRLENIAWSYASSIQSYEVFGDAVVFDTTHRLTAFDMPLGIWVGINNYGMPCFFACVLLREENLRSYSWALKAFLGFMNGKAPQTVLTDQNMCLKEAIAMEIPTSKHALCIWLIVAKFPSWFNAVLGERYNEWKAEFYRLYNLEAIEDFELGWRDMVNSFGMHTNRHIANLYSFRSLWALPYLRSHFFAGMTTTSQSKSINAFIQRFLSAQTRLAHFVEQVFILSDPKSRSCFCSLFVTAALVCSIFFIGSAFTAKDCKILPRWNMFSPKHITQMEKSKISVGGQTNDTEKDTQSNPCKSRCRPFGSEMLPEGIVANTSDLQMRPLWGPVGDNKNSKPSLNLLAIAAGIKQKENVRKIVEKFLANDFIVMLFHYDGFVDGWSDLEWSNRIIHISVLNQTKWWFAKRFLHPDIVAEYDYIFLWDEDLGVENFHPGRYLSVVKDEGLEISQPALDIDQSDVHHLITARLRNSTVHRRSYKLKGGGSGRCDENSTTPPCIGWVEMMAPVFSRAAWRCAWYMIQNDLIHAWGLDMQLGYCAQGDRTKNVGVVDSEYIVHLGLPTLGVSEISKESSVPSGVDYRIAVRRRSYVEMQIFKNRWRNAVKDDKCWVDLYPPPPLSTEQNKQ